MKPNNKKSTIVALSLAAALGALVLAYNPAPARADAACTAKCDRDWPKWYHKVQRGACKAKCWAADKAKAAVSKAKSVYSTVKKKASSAASTVKKGYDYAKKAATSVAKKTYNYAKSKAKSAANAVKRVAKGYWDKAKGCLSDGVGGCMKKVYKKAKETTKKAANYVKDKAKKAYEVGKKAYNYGKKKAKELYQKAKKVAKGAWDAAKRCVADGLGGCAKKIYEKAKKLARGAWDAAKRCYADGIGGCFKKIVKGALNVGCKGVGFFWDKARDCCVKQGAWTCIKKAAKAVIEKGKKWLCQKAVPLLERAASWLVNKAGSVLKNYRISLKGSEIGNLACAFKQQIGHVITDHAKRMGDPVLSLSGLTVGAKRGSKGLGLSFGATASVARKRGDPQAMHLRLDGAVDVEVDRSCTFSKPMLKVGARITNIAIGSGKGRITKKGKIESWLTNKAMQGYLRLGCFSFCMDPLKVQGMEVKLNLCKVLDTCLKNKCTEAVLNTLMKQIFPISVGVAGFVDKKKMPIVRTNLAGVTATVGVPRIRVNRRDPYKPSASISLSLNKKGGKSFRINAGATLAIKTVCRDDGRSMIKVTPSVGVKLGDLPQWMFDTAKKIGNDYIADIINKKGGKKGQFLVNWPGFLSGVKSKKKKKVSTESTWQKLKGVIEKVKNNWAAIKQAVKTAIKGRFVGVKGATRCSGLERTVKKFKPSGGACVECLRGGTASAASSSISLKRGTAYVTARSLRLRAGPSTKTKTSGYLKRCQRLSVKGLRGTWAQVSTGRSSGFSAAKYLSNRKPSGCR